MIEFRRRRLPTRHHSLTTATTPYVSLLPYHAVAKTRCHIARRHAVLSATSARCARESLLQGRMHFTNLRRRSRPTLYPCLP